jgi:Sec-independent protein translocase protein TatA
MEILGIGLPEMAFIVLIALILLGPKEMIETSRMVGKTLRKFVTSPTWQAMRTTGQELQQLPTKLMREAGLEELKEMEKEVQQAARINPRAMSVSFDEKQVFSDLPAPVQPATPPATPPHTPEA